MFKPPQFSSLLDPPDQNNNDNNDNRIGNNDPTQTLNPLPHTSPTLSTLTTTALHNPNDQSLFNVEYNDSSFSDLERDYQESFGSSSGAIDSDNDNNDNNDNHNETLYTTHNNASIMGIPSQFGRKPGQLGILGDDSVFNKNKIVNNRFADNTVNSIDIIDIVHHSRSNINTDNNILIDPHQSHPHSHPQHSTQYFNNTHPNNTNNTPNNTLLEGTTSPCVNYSTADIYINKRPFPIDYYNPTIPYPSIYTLAPVSSLRVDLNYVPL